MVKYSSRMYLIILLILDSCLLETLLCSIQSRPWKNPLQKDDFWSGGGTRPCYHPWDLYQDFVPTELSKELV